MGDTDRKAELIAKAAAKQAEVEAEQAVIAQHDETLRAGILSVVAADESATDTRKSLARGVLQLAVSLVAVHGPKAFAKSTRHLATLVTAMLGDEDGRKLQRSVRRHYSAVLAAEGIDADAIGFVEKASTTTSTTRSTKPKQVLGKAQEGLSDAFEHVGTDLEEADRVSLDALYTMAVRFVNLYEQHYAGRPAVAVGE